MKVLIIHYSQSGNTMLIARHIEKGLRKANAEVDVVKLKDAGYEMMRDYDLIGLGSPTWKADTPYVYWHPQRPYFTIPKDLWPLDLE